METLKRIHPAGLIGALVILCLTFTACTPAETNETVVTAAELAASTIATAEPGVPGIALASSYINAVGQAVDCTITERQSADSPAVQATKIAQCASAAVLPALPPGTPTTVVTLLNKVAAALANYLASLPTAAKAKALDKLDGGDLSRMHVRVAIVHDKLKR